MARNPDRKIDKTHLSIDQAEKRGFIHRDYIAHCLRWTHVVKQLYQGSRYKTARIIDIGCGKEMPLAKLLHSSRLAPTEGYYLGVDVNKLELPEQFENTSWKPQFSSKTNFMDLSLRKLGLEDPNIITCFEVLEHVTPAMAREMVAKMREMVDPDDGLIFISTPCWDPDTGAADNHINEMRFEAMAALLNQEGLRIREAYGTFASQKDYKKSLSRVEAGGSPELLTIFNRLSEYYDSNYLATVFAPLFPQLSRNVLWVCDVATPRESAEISKYFDIDFESVEEPWTSSEDWKELSK